jgi:hypothetical protein
MNPEFACLPVTVLFHTHYYDGPLSGVCEHEKEKLYFWCLEELLFKYAETDPQIIASESNPEELYQYHRCRVFNVYRLPEDIMSIVLANNDLWEELKNSRKDEWHKDYAEKAQKLPEYFDSWEAFAKVSWKWLVGYTTEDVWDRRNWVIKRHNLNG